MGAPSIRGRREDARGLPEILGIDVTTAEDGAQGWLTFLQSLTARGLVRRQTGDLRAFHLRDCWPPSAPPCATTNLAALPNALRDPILWPSPEERRGRGCARRCTWCSKRARRCIPLQAQYDRIIDALARRSSPRPLSRRSSGPRGPAGVHRVPETDLAPNLVRTIRWNGSTRRSRRARTDVVGTASADRNALIRLVGAVLARTTRRNRRITALPRTGRPQQITRRYQFSSRTGVTPTAARTCLEPLHRRITRRRGTPRPWT